MIESVIILHTANSAGYNRQVFLVTDTLIPDLTIHVRITNLSAFCTCALTPIMQAVCPTLTTDRAEAAAVLVGHYVVIGENVTTRARLTAATRMTFGIPRLFTTNCTFIMNVVAAIIYILFLHYSTRTRRTPVILGNFIFGISAARFLLATRHTGRTGTVPNMAARNATQCTRTV